MQLPTIHSNGTSAKALAESYQYAATELSAALNALMNVELNGRDYYPKGDHAFVEAAKEQHFRCQKLREVINETQAIADHCWEFVK